MIDLSKLFRAEVTLTEDNQKFNVPIDSITAYQDIHDNNDDFDEAKDSGDGLTRVHMNCENFDSTCDVKESRKEIADLIAQAESERADKIRKLNFGIR
tara:strand:- start:93 stop:386 length:294 start_codon:yes stop_codon:yes gene_type:complete